MQIWPAIDLLGGKCVRLRQGDYEQNTVFSDSPGETAAKWFADGAQFLHCVDLDGAKTGKVINEQAIRDIVQAAGQNPVQLGGGVRDAAAVERLLDLGLTRLVMGTAALKQPEMFAQLCERYPSSMVLGLDARNGMIATEGWLESSQTSAVDLVKQIESLTDNIEAIVYTDIAKDGMMAGPNFESLTEIMAAARTPVVCSGGVTTLDDVKRLVDMNTPACIIGRSLYEGHVDLGEVLEIASH